MSCRISLCMCLLLLVAVPCVAEEDYVAHEWGTFTSFQGSDGVALEWRSLATSELPSFVYDRSRSNLDGQIVNTEEFLCTKSSLSSLQRMETPVIYFYPKKEMVVDVSVRFPDGLITEWFPQVRDFSPKLSADKKSVPVKEGLLRWGKIRLFPAAEHPEMLKLIPEATPEGRNYFAARETDSAIVRVGTVKGVEKFDYEKFLFYRGVGNFAMPLQISTGGNKSATLKNTGTEPIGKIFILCVEDGCAPYVAIDGIKAGETKRIEFPSVKDANVSLLRADLSTERLAKEMEDALVDQGLYRREAAAMVKTWRDSWFTEPGLRVFYLLPQSWTDAALPLSLDPKPAEIKRVMVGRAELLTPEMERAIASQVTDLGSADFNVREKASAAIAKLGRFTEPALKRVLEASNDEEVKSRAKKLLEEIRRPASR